MQSHQQIHIVANGLLKGYFGFLIIYPMWLESRCLGARRDIERRIEAIRRAMLNQKRFQKQQKITSQSSQISPPSLTQDSHGVQH